MNAQYLSRLAKLVAPALLLSSCAHYSTSGLREEPAALVATSTRSVGEIAGCLNAAWNRRGTVNSVPNGQGGSVSLAPPGLVLTAYLLLADIDDLGSNRRVTLHIGPMLLRHRIVREREIVTGCL